MEDTKKRVLRQLSIGDLSEEFERQSAYFADWAFEHADAQDTVRLAQEKVDLLFSEYYAEARERDSGAKENDCKAYIRSRSPYRVAQRRLRKAQYTADITRAAVKAFEMKASMLMQLGADRRAEYESTDLGGRLKKRKDFERKKAEAEKALKEKFTKKKRRVKRGTEEEE